MARGHTGKAEIKPQRNLRISRECRNSGKYGHKAADCWHKHPKRNPKYPKRVRTTSTAIDFVTSKHGQVSWICRRRAMVFLKEDSTKHRQKVSWDENWLEEYEQTNDHEFLIDSGCCGHVCPPWCALQFLVTSASNVNAAAANQVALQHQGHIFVHGHMTSNGG